MNTLSILFFERLQMNREELQAVMDDKDLTPSELARRMGISPAIVSRWRNGVSKMSRAKDKELRRVLEGFPPKESAEDEVKDLLREKIVLLERMLEERDAEVERLKKLLSDLESKPLPAVREATDSRGQRVNG